MTKQNYIKGTKILADISRLQSEVRVLNTDIRLNPTRIVWDKEFNLPNEPLASFSISAIDLDILDEAIDKMTAVRERMIEELGRFFERL